MKDQFIEKDGLLFMKCEPEPLEVNSEMPCIAQFVQDDSRLGRHNIHTIREEYLNSQYLIKDIEDEVLVDDKFIEAETNRLKEQKISECLTIVPGSHTLTPMYVGDAYTQLEIIAKHCPEGSREWALWQMLNGKKVCNHSYHGGVPLKISDSSVQKWARNAFEYNCEIVSFMRYFKEYQTGWKIYEEPKPEVDKWYWNKAHNEYCYAIKHYDDLIEMRCPGTLSTYFFDLMEVDDLVEAFLDPDFSNAKFGDKCYSTLVGDMEISCVYHQEKYGVKAYHEKSGLSACYTNSGFYDKHHIHPALFNSAAQCAAYFAEVALEERKEQ